MTLPRPARAQTIETGVTPTVSKETGRRYGGVGYFSLAGMLMDHGEMNDRLTAQGLPDASSATLMLGSGGYFRLNRILLGGEGHWLSQREASNATHTTQVAGGFGFVNFGYIVGSWGGLALFPMIGVGGGGLSYTVTRKAGEGTFDQALADPGRATTFSTGGLVGHISIGLDHLFDFNKKPNEAGGVLVGLRLGWAMQLPKGNWKANDADLNGGPSVGLGGPFLRLVLGGGGVEIE